MYRTCDNYQTAGTKRPTTAPETLTLQTEVTSDRLLVGTAVPCIPVKSRGVGSAGKVGACTIPAAQGIGRLTARAQKEPDDGKADPSGGNEHDWWGKVEDIEGVKSGCSTTVGAPAGTDGSGISARSGAEPPAISMWAVGKGASGTVSPDGREEADGRAVTRLMDDDTLKADERALHDRSPFVGGDVVDDLVDGVEEAASGMTVGMSP